MLDNISLVFLLLISTTIILIMVYGDSIKNKISQIFGKMNNVSGTYDYSVNIEDGALEVDIQEIDTGLPGNKERREMDKLNKNLQRSREGRIPAPYCANGECNGQIDPLKDTAEVFLVSDNHFTYEEAEPLCQAYGAKLATIEQIQDAYTKGADWCNYGWIKGQMAVYPTQPDTYYRLQKSDDDRVRNKCGKIGVNGGKFPVGRRFGVHCYGPKPATWNEYAAKCKLTKPLTPEELERKRKANLMRKNLDNYTLRPFNQQYWAENY